MNNTNQYQFPEWIYDTAHNKSASNVLFTNDEIIAINQALITHKQILKKNILLMILLIVCVNLIAQLLKAL